MRPLRDVPAPSPARDATGREVVAFRDGAVGRRHDRLTGEEPMAIRVAGPGQDPVDVAITMRTPGHDAELALGFLVSEGLVGAADAALARAELGDPGRIAQPENEVVVRLPRRFDPALVPARAFVVSASCGICGRASLDEAALRCPPLPPGPSIGAATILRLPASLRERQAVFDETGGLHAAGLFDVEGRVLRVCEDVGRHNAVDKLIGASAAAGELPLHAGVLLVSGRVSFEIVQKAAMAGIPIVAAVSAPTDLAVAAAERLGMTLVGFVRGAGFNLYAGDARVRFDDAARAPG